MTEFLFMAMAAFGLCVVATFIAVILTTRQRALSLWFLTYLRQLSKYRSPRPGDPVHLLLCIADHFEPGNGGVSAAIANQRLRNWIERLPRLCGQFRDSDGRAPRHTFFYPVDMYNERELDDLAGLCGLGLGEVEIHLHHEGDTSENLRRTLISFKNLMACRHGLLARHRDTGEIRYAFVHGNWALDNSHPEGRCCGVNNEIEILLETGCYADFTLPSAPSRTQTRKINSIYYAVDDPTEPKSHDWGVDVGRGPGNGLVMIQGPLILDWQRRKWGIFPRVENGCIQGNQPPGGDRIDTWLRARVQVPTRPDWYFVKLHTHGGPEKNQEVLLGEPMAEFHRALAQRAARDPSFHFHYVSAREMYNLVRAAEAGWQGPVSEVLNFELVSTQAKQDDSTDTSDQKCAIES